MVAPDLINHRSLLYLTIIGYGDITNVIDEHLVQSTGPRDDLTMFDIAIVACIIDATMGRKTTRRRTVHARLFDPDFRSPSIPARDIGSTVFYATVERLTRLSPGCQTSCPAANPLLVDPCLAS